MDEPEYGDYVWIYWLVGTQHGSAGKVTGQEYDAHIEEILSAGYGVLTTQPPGQTIEPPVNPNSAISVAKVQELINGLDILTPAAANATYVRGKVEDTEGNPVPTKEFVAVIDANGDIENLIIREVV